MMIARFLAVYLTNNPFNTAIRAKWIAKLDMIWYLYFTSFYLFLLVNTIKWRMELSFSSSIISLFDYLALSSSVSLKP